MKRMNPKIVSYKAGSNIGGWEVVCFAGTINGRAMWTCRCACGNICDIRGSVLSSGKPPRSCAKCRTHYALKHGENQRHKRTVEYGVWSSIRTRCYNPKRPEFKYYGGRGIKMCDRWKESYENFLDDMGRKPSPEHSIDRIDVNGDYDPSNCRWATRNEQLRNRTDNVMITYLGKTQCSQDWGKELGIKPATIRRRIGLGWDPVSALTEPLRQPWGHPRKKEECDA